MLTHEQKVQRICEQLRNRKSAAPVSFKKKVISHQVPKPGSPLEKDEKIDLSDLNEIIHIDAANKTCIAEPGVTFSDLVKATLKHNLVPILVPELKTITIGGAVSGCSVESTSYKYGGFHDSCLEYEVITAKGNVLVCTPENEHKHIFQMMHGTFGTIGILSKLKFKLMDAKPYVKMSYEKYTTLDDYKAAIQRHYEAKDVDFMDGLIHSPTNFVLCIGNFVDTAPYISRYDWMKVFYKSTLNRTEDYLKTYDYFFRYDSDCHWVMRNFGFENPILRFLLGKFALGSTNILTNAKRLAPVLKHLKPDVVVDIFIPFSNFGKFLDFYNREFNYFPLWVVPYKRVRDYEWISKDLFSKIPDELFLDLAVYGMRQKGEKNYYKMMEQELLKLNGIKTLISHNFYDKDTFWTVWNKENYFSAKNITDPDNIFRDLYQKTHARK